MSKRTFTCGVLLLVASFCPGQQLSKKMTDQDVIDMVSLGLSDEVIIDKIHATEGTDFDTGVSGLRALKAARVSDAVIRAIINSHPVAPAVNNAPAVLPPDTSGTPWEIGVYIVIKGKPIEIEPEIVNWQNRRHSEKHRCIVDG